MSGLVVRTTLRRGLLALVAGADAANWVLLALEDATRVRLYYNWGGNVKRLDVSVPGDVTPLNDAAWHKVRHAATPSAPATSLGSV